MSKLTREESAAAGQLTDWKITRDHARFVLSNFVEVRNAASQPKPELPDEVIALCGSVPPEFSEEIYRKWRDAIVAAYKAGKAGK